MIFLGSVVILNANHDLTLLNNDLKPISLSRQSNTWFEVSVCPHSRHRQRDPISRGHALTSLTCVKHYRHLLPLYAETGPDNRLGTSGLNVLCLGWEESQGIFSPTDHPQDGSRRLLNHVLKVYRAEGTQDARGIRDRPLSILNLSIPPGRIKHDRWFSFLVFLSAACNSPSRPGSRCTSSSRL